MSRSPSRSMSATATPLPRPGSPTPAAAVTSRNGFAEAATAQKPTASTATEIEQFRQILPISSLLLILGGPIHLFPPLPRLQARKAFLSRYQRVLITARAV